MSTCHEWRNSPAGRYTAFCAYGYTGYPHWKAEIDVLMKRYVIFTKKDLWLPWPEGIETIEDMKAYIETMHRMGEL